MDSRLLIDAVVRQTTLLIAQLATSAGIRAPLAHLADQVFLDLAREIEQQGVSRKVAADMFGLALRTYQRKVGRLRESVSVAEKTLWQAVLDHVRSHGSVTRSQVLAAFARDESEDVVAVLGDLVASGLLYATGRGKQAAYGATSRSDQDALFGEQRREMLLHMVWLELAAPAGLTQGELSLRFPEYPAELTEVLATLVGDGRARCDVTEGVARYRTSNVRIPVGSEAGWETAVLDHFRAVCTALSAKLARGGAASPHATLIGGSTLSFDLCAGHPYEAEVKGLLARMRSDLFEVWTRVSEHNKAQPVADEELERVVFYLGQNFIPRGPPDAADRAPDVAIASENSATNQRGTP
jgi:hypothetical protein